MAFNEKRDRLLTLMIMFASVVLFSFWPATLSSHSIATSSQIIIEGNNINYTTTLPLVPQELVNISGQVKSRVVAEYSSEFFSNDLNLSSQLLNITETVNPRLRAEYSTEMLSKQLPNLPSDLAQLTSEANPRIMIEYSSILFTTSLIQPIELVNDTTPPTIGEPIQIPHDFVNAYQNVTVTVNVTDLDTGVWKATLLYNVNNGQAWTPLNMSETSTDTYQATVPGYENDTLVKYEITAFDNMGNQATRDNNGDYYIYQVGTLKPPTVYITSPENATYSTNNVSLTFTVDEPTGWMGCSIDDHDNSTITGNTTLTNLLDGDHYIVVYCNSTNGNMGKSDTVQFAIDTTPPNLTDISQIPTRTSVTPADEVRINATVSDATSGVKDVTLNYTTNNSTYLTIGMTNLGGDIYTATIPTLPLGTNVTYLIMAEDKTNNTITTEQLGFTYQYKVIPEFPSFLVLELFMMTTLLTVIACKRKTLHFARYK